jgi:hypothetical protein
MTTVFAGSPLLGDAESVLSNAGFATRSSELPDAGAAWVVAENEFFIVGVVATPTFEVATRLEPFATAQLARGASEPEVGGKRWDAYLVVLCEELVEDAATTRRLVEFQHDTRGLRRLVATGVTDKQRVAEALRPFLPLPPPTPGGLADAFAVLEDQLALNGIDRAQAERYVAIFSESRTLDDA